MKVRPIDANVLREEIMVENYDNDTINNFLDLVDFAPTLDYEPVVYCKDCGYWSGKEIYPGIRKCENRSFGYNIFTRGNDFCSYGAKMDEEVANDK